MKADKRSKMNSGSFLILLASLICIVLLGISFAQYRAQQKHVETASLSDFRIEVVDLATMEHPDWVIELPATTRLYDDSHFDSTVVAKRLMITNKGNQLISLKAKLLNDITTDYHKTLENVEDASDIILFVAGGDIQDQYQKAIQDAVGAALNETSVISDMKNEIGKINTSNLADWSYDLAPGESRFLTILVWRENAAVNGENSFGKTYYLNQHLELDVSQK